MSYLHAIKMILIGMSGIALSGCLEEEIDARQTEVIQGLIYKLHDNEPFSGRITGFPSRTMGLSISSPACNIEVKKGLPDGQADCYFPNSQLSNQLVFSKGLIDGTWREWTADGKLAASRDYRQHKLHGKSEIYNTATGKLRAEGEYNDGQLDGSQKIWSISGDLITDLHWANGQKTGVETLQDWEYNWQDGKKHGVQKQYLSQRDKRYLYTEEVYENGLLHGTKRAFNSDGELVLEEVYVQDAIQSRTERHIEYGKKTKERSFVRNPEKDSNYKGYDALVPDGVERVWDLKGNLLKEIHWERGAALSGLRQQWRDSELIGVIHGVPDEKGSLYLVKHGLERIYEGDGPANVIVEWNNGKAVAIAANRDLPFSTDDQGALLRLLSMRYVEVTGEGLDDYATLLNQPDTSDYLYSIKVPDIAATTLSTATKVIPNVADCVNRYQQYLKRTGNKYLLNDIDALTRECS